MVSVEEDSDDDGDLQERLRHKRATFERKMRVIEDEQRGSGYFLLLLIKSYSPFQIRFDNYKIISSCWNSICY